MLHIITILFVFQAKSRLEIYKRNAEVVLSTYMDILEKVCTNAHETSGSTTLLLLGSSLVVLQLKCRLMEIVQKI